MTPDAIPTVFGFKKPGLSLRAISRPSMTPLPRCSECTRVAEASTRSTGGAQSTGVQPPRSRRLLVLPVPHGPGNRASLGSGLEHWLRHLADEHPSVLRDLLAWLATRDGIIALRQIASYHPLPRSASMTDTPTSAAIDTAEEQAVLARLDAIARPLGELRTPRRGTERRPQRRPGERATLALALGQKAVAGRSGGPVTGRR